MKKGANVLAKNCHLRTPLEEAKKSQINNAGIDDVVSFLAKHQVRYFMLLYISLISIVYVC